MKIVVIGGGAGGYFAALTAKKLNPTAEILVLEKSAKVLNKVRISGGGRCNVTHGCFDPKMLIKNYPRGSKELLGAFSRFQPLDTIDWFKKRGVILKQEDDNRIFPISNSSETIIKCFQNEVEKLKIKVHIKTKIDSICKIAEQFELTTSKNELITADRIILATGSSKDGFRFAEELGHTIKAPLASLFTFNIFNFTLSNLSGVSVEKVKLKLLNSNLESTGPMLITHWGFSGPAALKLSSFGARVLAERNYLTKLKIDWVVDLLDYELIQLIETACKSHPKKQLGNLYVLPIPKNLWRALCKRFNLSTKSSLASLNRKDIINFSKSLKNDTFNICGKTTNKEEFVTCGGVSLSEIEFKTMESKICKGLFFCGEIIDIDGITGGFNFQNAWTTGSIAGSAVIS
jgi:predicted Rossmann fold flavoprotein